MAVIENRINNDGTKTYRVKIRVKGQKPISKTFARRTDAVLWAKRTEVEIAEGRYFPERAGKAKTLADLIDRYIAMELPKRQKDRKRVEMHLNWWMGYEGSGTRAVSPVRSSTHMRCARPSLAPIETTTSLSGSMSTPKRRSYQFASASRSLLIPRDAE